MNNLSLRLICARLFAIFALAILPAAGPVSAAQDAPDTPAAKTYETWSPRPRPVDVSTSPNIPVPERAASSMVWCDDSNLERFTRYVFERYDTASKQYDLYKHEICERYNNKPTRITQSAGNDFYARLGLDGSLVFVSDRSGNDEIYASIRTISESKATRLTKNSAVDTQPAFSPDGQQVVFVSTRHGNAEIYTMTNTGDSVRRLTNSSAVDIEPDWSPDGTKIAWIRRSGNNGLLYVKNADGTGAEKMLATLRYGGHASWSPDGKRLAFEYDANNDGWLDLGVINADGSGLAKLIISSWEEHYDLTLGSWYGGPGKQGIFYNLIAYKRYGDRWYIHHTSLAFKGNYDSSGTNLIGDFEGWYTFSPHARIFNTTLPKVSIDPLPRYSLKDFNVTMRYAHELFDGFLTLYTRKDPSESWQTLISKKRVYSSGPGVDKIFTYKYTGVPGETRYFLVTAEDEAGNPASHAQGASSETSTQIYQYHAQASVLDARETPLNGALINAGPGAFDQPVETVNGSADVYFFTGGSQDVSISKPGFGELPILTWPVESQSEFLYILPPQNNLIANSYFEDPAGPFNGWNTGGALPVGTTTGRYGGNAARLGLDCYGALCLTPPEEVPLSGGGSGSLVIDSQGGVHNLNGPSYFYRSPAGQWQQGDSLRSTGYDRLSILPNGTPFTLIRGNELTFAYLPVGGVWTYESIGSYNYSNYRGSAISDDLGQVHLVYNDSDANQMIYKKRLASGQWQDSIIIGTRIGVSPILAMAADGGVHVASIVNDPDTHHYDQIAYLHIAPDGSSGPVEYLTPFNDPEMQLGYTIWLLMDAGGTLQLFAHDEEYMYFWSRDPALGWSDVQVKLIPPHGTDTLNVVDAALDPDGKMHIYFWCIGSCEPNELFEVVRTPGESGYYLNRVLTGYTNNSPAMALDASGELHLVWSNTFLSFYYQKQQRLNEPAGSRLAQTVSLPADMHEPTLSFFYRLEQGYPHSTEGLRLLVTPQDGSPVTLFEESPGANSSAWRHAWFDLSPWKGQAVEVAFALEQLPGENGANLYLDEVTLGAWTTPTITGFTPMQIDWPAGEDSWIDITGENFMEGSQVYFGDQPAAEVIWVDSAHVRCRPPATLPFGYYTLRLENPGGVTSDSFYRLLVGKALYLPAIMR